MKHLSVIAALATLGPVAALAAPEWQMVLEAERVAQSFSDGDSDIDTVTLAPAIHRQDWSFSATVAWQRIDGIYFVNNAYPNLEYLCNQINSLTPAQKLLLVYRDALTPDQVQYCNQTGGVESGQLQDKVEGFSDLEMFANYYLPLFHDNISGTLGFGYKHDNGDADKGLGTGTRDTFVETSWLLELGPVGALATLGYEHILHNGTSIDLQDYGYGALEGFWRPADPITVSVEYHYQQAAADVLEDFDYLVYSLRLGRDTGWGCRLFYTDYQNEAGFPDEEIGGSLSYAF